MTVCKWNDLLDLFIDGSVCEGGRGWNDSL